MERDGFFFLGNQLALDFVNTRPVIDGEPMELLDDFSALLRWFLAAELLTRQQAAALDSKWGTTPHGRRINEIAKAFRENQRAQVVVWEQGGSLRRSFLAEVNELLANYPMRSRLVGSKDTVQFEPWFEPEELLAPLADAAARLFTEFDATRIRQCGQCVLHFLDTSKKGTRRWCSMQVCGNRQKVAAYAARQRGGISEPAR